MCILFRLVLAPFRPADSWCAACLWHSNDFLLLSLKWPIVQLATYCVCVPQHRRHLIRRQAAHLCCHTACGIYQSTCETCSISYFRSPPRCFNNDNIANYTPQVEVQRWASLSASARSLTIAQHKIEYIFITFLLNFNTIKLALKSLVD